MQKTLKRTSVTLLIICMTLLAIPTPGFAEESITGEGTQVYETDLEEINPNNAPPLATNAMDNQMYVNGIDAIAQNEGEGWHYDNATRTLTLEGATLSQVAANQRGVIQGSFTDETPLNLVLNGESTINVPSDGSCLYISGNLEITGSGSLTGIKTDIQNQTAMINVAQGLNENTPIPDTGNLKYIGTGRITLLSGVKTYEDAQKDNIGINCYGNYTQTGATVILGNEDNWLGTGLNVGSVTNESPSNMTISSGTLSVVSRIVGITIGNGDMLLENGAQIDVLKHDNWEEPSSQKWQELGNTNDSDRIGETYGIQVFSGSTMPFASGLLNLSGGSTLSVKMLEESKDFVQSIGVHALRMSVAEGSKINSDVEGTFAYGITIAAVNSSSEDAKPDLLVRDSEMNINVSTLHVGDGIRTIYARFDNSKINTEIKGKTYNKDYYYAVAALQLDSNPFNPNMTFKNNLEVLNGSKITAKASYSSDIDQVLNEDESNTGTVEGIWSFGGILIDNSSILSEANLDAQKKMEIPVAVEGVHVTCISGENSQDATGHIKALESSITAKATSNLPKLRADQSVGGIWADQTIELNNSDMNGVGSNWGIAAKENMSVMALKKDQIIEGKAGLDGVGIVSIEGELDITTNHISIPTTGVIGKIENSRFNNATAVVEKEGSKTAAAEARIESGTPVKILTDPSNTTINPGEKATFSLKAEGNTPIIYQWEVSTDNGKTWAMIENATGEVYTTDAVTAEMNGSQYRCIATNAWNSVASQSSTLTVTSAPTPTPAPTPAPTPNNGGKTNVGTGITDTQTGTICAILFLSIAGLVALGLKRKFSR